MLGGGRCPNHGKLFKKKSKHPFEFRVKRSHVVGCTKVKLMVELISLSCITWKWLYLKPTFALVYVGYREQKKPMSFLNN